MAAIYAGLYGAIASACGAVGVAPATVAVLGSSAGMVCILKRLEKDRRSSKKKGKTEKAAKKGKGSSKKRSSKKGGHKKKAPSTKKTGRDYGTPASMGCPDTPSLSSVTSSRLPGYGSTSVA
eukprot:647640_1